MHLKCFIGRQNSASPSRNALVENFLVQNIRHVLSCNTTKMNSLFCEALQRKGKKKGQRS